MSVPVAPPMKKQTDSMGEKTKNAIQIRMEGVMVPTP